MWHYGRDGAPVGPVSHPDLCALFADKELTLETPVWHEGLAVARDMMRDNVHEIIGLPTLRFGWQPVVGAPCVVAEQVATALVQRGWRGEPGVCDRCRQPTGAD